MKEIQSAEEERRKELEQKYEARIKNLQRSVKLMFRFPIDEGVAGYVARTGKSINLADAYRCQYFNPGIDQDV